MSAALTAESEIAQQRCAQGRARIEDVRDLARRRFDGGATGIQTAAAIAEATDCFVVDTFEDALSPLDEKQRAALLQNSAVVAVGGSGRADPAPCSDLDLLFLYRPAVEELFTERASAAVRNLWDAGVKLGHAVRTVADTLSLARDEPDVATALVEARPLTGDAGLFEELRGKFRRRIQRSGGKAFIEAAVTAREQERDQFGGAVQQLEPDVKRAPGGLRDLHLIRWIGAARYDAPEIDALRLNAALTKGEARDLLAAFEFLTRVRIDLHFAAGRQQDVLTREDQLRIADKRGIKASVGMRPVEHFMQTYFRHTTTVFEIVRRFATRNRPSPIAGRVKHGVLAHKSDGVFRVGPDTITVARRHRKEVCSSLERMLKFFHTAALYDVPPAPEMIEAVRRAEPALSGELTEPAAAVFLDILKCAKPLGPVLRNLYETGLLEFVIPNMAHARCLLQFNQYHSYTVDEHTLRAVEAVLELADEDEPWGDGPLGEAYRAIHHKEILHLALLLHDLGKGFDEDHSDVGRVIAASIADRLNLPDHHRDTLVFLVHQHLTMAHVAFRRDITDPDVLTEFAKLVGSPETLRMLYTLTAADVRAVGPGVWTDWKAELLTELYDRAMMILGGRRFEHHEQQRRRVIEEHVVETLTASDNCASPLKKGSGPLRNASDNGESSAGQRVRPLFQQADQEEIAEWVREQLDSFAPHYLAATHSTRIAADLEIIRDLGADEISINGHYDEETGTVDYRVIMHGRYADGCFYKTAAALSAQRLEILSAQITTSIEGVVVDSYVVRDDDHAGRVPAERIEAVADSIRTMLTDSSDAATLFRRHRRYGGDALTGPNSELPTRVVVDNDTSERSTVIDVFAHDRRGLLYTIARAIYDLDLSVMLAKIATHLDQVLDVFYVTDRRGEKIRNADRLSEIPAAIQSAIEDLERNGRERYEGG